MSESGTAGVGPGPEAGGAPTPPLAAAAVKGFAWQVASFGGNRLVVFASTLVLARLLTPREFGTFAAALVFTQYLEVLLDFGLGSYVVYEQQRDATDRLHVAFTFNLILTAVLTAATVGLSPQIAALFGARHQAAVFAAMAGYLVLRGLSQVNQAVVQRDLMFKQIVVVDLSAAVTRAAVSVALAVAGMGVWAIVIGFLGGQAVSTGAMWLLVRYRPRIRFDWRLGRRMLGFGANSVAIDLLTELSLNADYLVVGGMLGATALGFYTIAYRLPELLINNLFWLFAKVAFPVYARSRVDGMDALRSVMLRALRITTLYGFAAGLGLALVSRSAILVLFGGQWHQSITPMAIIAMAAAVASASYASGPLFPAIGRPGVLVIANIPLTVARVGGFVLAAPYGIVWVAFVHLATNLIMIFVRLAIANRVTATTLRQDLAALRPALVASAGVVALGAPPALAMSPGLASLIVTIAAGSAGAVGALLLGDRPVISEMRGLATHLLSRG